MGPFTIAVDRDAVFNEAGAKLLQEKLGDVTFVQVGKAELASALRSAHALILGHLYVTRAHFEQAPRLRIVSRVGVGYNTIDLQAATEHGVMVTNVGEVTVPSVAEHAIALAFAVARSIPRCDAVTRRVDWHLRQELSETNLELFGKTMGIIGLGKIGSHVARLATGLGMQVVYHDLVRKPDLEEQYGWTFLPLEDLLRTADVISMHLPLTDKTRRLINAHTLSLMKRDAIIVNQSRGAVVDEPALVEALRSGRIRGYAADVYEPEPPPPGSPLLQLENVVLTPHIAGLSREARIRACRQVALNIIHALRGQRPPNLVNPEVWRGE